MDALFDGPKTADQLKCLVGKGFAGRISEYNKVYGDIFKIKNIDKQYRIFRQRRVAMHHKRAYPDYYVNGTYEWPAKQTRRIATNGV